MIACVMHDVAFSTPHQGAKNARLPPRRRSFDYILRAAATIFTMPGDIIDFCVLPISDDARLRHHRARREKRRRAPASRTLPASFSCRGTAGCASAVADCSRGGMLFRRDAARPMKAPPAPPWRAARFIFPAVSQASARKGIFSPFAWL